MKKVLKKALSVMLVVVIMLTAAPLSGFVGLQLPEWLDFSVNASATATTGGKCGDDLIWTFDETTGVLTISGTGEMYDYSADCDGNDNTPWASYKNDIKDVVIQDGVITRNHIETAPVVENEVAPTCTIDGSYDTVVYCSLCGEELSREAVTVPALGHDFEAGTVTTAPTCTADGVKTFTCLGCGDEYTEIIPATGHINTTTTRVEPTCNADGKITVTCVCGEVISETIIPALAHEYYAYVTTPTCTEDGYTTFTCSECGDSYTSDEIEATGHLYEAVVTAPTCEEDGYTTFTCSECGDSYTADEVPALGHTEFEIPAVAATCTTNGYTAGVNCSECGEILTASVEISATGHNYIDGVCEYCGDGTITKLTGTCGDNATWEFDESTGTLTISGTGEIDGYIPWENYVENVKTIVINYGITSLGEVAFDQLDTLISVIIPNSVTTISAGAFLGCDSLTNVTIPESVTTIGELAFAQCNSLTGITVDSNNQYYSSDEYGVLFNKDKTILIQYPNGNTRDNYMIPENVTTIDHCSFFCCYSLTSVIIPDSVTFIDYDAFCYCYSLTSITIGGGVITIGEDAFRGCDSLTDVYYSGTAKQWSAISIGSNNNPLLDATIHYNYVSHSHLYDAIVTVPTCTENGYTTYICECGDTYVSDEVFALGHYMQETSSAIAPTCTMSGVTSRYECVNGCGTVEGGETIDATGHIEGTAVFENEVAPTCTAIGSYDSVVYCSVCDSEISRETFIIDILAHTEGPSVVENEVSSTCGADGSYDNVIYCTVCGEELYRETVTIPALGEHITGDTVKENEVAATCVTSGSYDMVIYCVICGVELSRTTISVEATGEHVYANIIEKVEPSCTEDGYVVKACGCSDDVYEKTILPATGHDYSSGICENTNCPDEWFGKIEFETGASEVSECFAVNAQTTEAQNNVLSIGAYAFCGCENLESVSMPDTIISIGEYAFYNCSSLESVVIPDSATTVGNDAFYSCDSLTSVTIGNSVAFIGEGAFDSCDSLTSITVDSDNKYYSSDEYGILFDKDKTTLVLCPDGIKITNYVIPDTVRIIQKSAFSDCKSISGELVIPNSVQSIGNEAFARCINISEVIIGTGLMNLYGDSDASSFYGCSGITSMTFLGEAVPYINDSETATSSNISYITKFFSKESLENLTTIYTLSDAIEDYKSAWEDYVPSTVTFSSGSYKLPVLNLAVDYLKSHSVSISWNESLSEEIIGYNIYRNGVLVGTITDTTFEDSNLDIETTYEYSVCGYTTTGHESQPSSIVVKTVTPNIIDIYTDNDLYKVGVTTNSIYATVKDDSNLDGGIARFYYEDSEGNLIQIGEDITSYTEKIENNAVYMTDWDITDIAEGDYEIIFEFADSDGENATHTQTITVDKSRPSAIASVVAIADTNQIVLTWAIAAEIDTNKYHIYRRSENEEEFSLVKEITNRSILSYTDTSVDKTSTYYYYVVGVNSWGQEGSRSVIVSATPLYDTEAPTIKKITPANGDYLTGTVTFTVTATDNVAVTNGELYYSTDDGETWTMFAQADSDSFNRAFDSTIVPDGKVKIKISVYDELDNECSETYTYMVDNTAPAKVEGVVAKSVLSSKITLSWDMPEDKDVSHFILEKYNGSSFVVVASKINDYLGYNVSNLQPETEYVFRVAAVDFQGNRGEYSEEYSVTTLKDTTAPVITKLTPTSGRYNNSISFVTTATDDCSIAAMTIQKSTDAVNWTDIHTKTFTSNSSETTYTYVVSLADEKEGNLFLRTIATDANSNNSDTSAEAPYVQYIVDKTGPNAPTGVKATGFDGYISIEWQKGEESDLGTYSVYRATSEDGDYVRVASSLAKVQWYDRNVDRETTYYYKICVSDSCGNLSDYSQVVSAVSLEDTVAPVINSINPATGSLVGAGINYVRVLASDNNTLDKIVVEYKVGLLSSYETLAEFTDINNYYKTVTATLPMDELSDGDTIYIRAYCKDIAGLESGYSDAVKLTVDKTAPELENLNSMFDKNAFTITWNDCGESDLAGFRVYCSVNGGSYSAIGSKGVADSNSYSFSHTVETEGTYVFRIDCVDSVGNTKSYYSENMEIDIDDIEKPVELIAKITSDSYLEQTVEYIFSASNSVSSDRIVSYLWNFGDGTTSDIENPVKSYSEVGEYTVKLTVTDSLGNVNTTEKVITVSSRSLLGTVKVIVVDDSGIPIPYAPVYLDFGDENQQIVYADETGVVEQTMSVGTHSIAVYKDGYLPKADKIICVAGDVSVLTLSTKKQELITGKFEVHEMDFEEIVEAGIDVNDPENQQIYEVKATLIYGTDEIPVKYIRNDEEIISYIIDDSNNTSGGGGSGGSFTPGGGGGSSGNKIGGIFFVPNKQNQEIIAAIEVPAEASYLKQFYSANLYIINNAAHEFEIVNCVADITVPDGLTVMQHTPISSVIYGQQSSSANWILRGDKEGTYNLKAHFSGVLNDFNVPVSATFEAGNPVVVYGPETVKLRMEVCDEIVNDTLYFNVGLVNQRPIGVNCPRINIVDYVKVVTEAVKNNEDVISGEEYDCELLRIRVDYSDGTSKYFEPNSTSEELSAIMTTLPPGAGLFYEYVVYELIGSDELAYFHEASVECAGDYYDAIEVVPISLGEFGVLDYFTSFCSSSDYIPDLASLLASLSVSAYDEEEIVEVYEALGFENIFGPYNYDGLATYDPYVCGYTIGVKKSKYCDEMVCLISIRGSKTVGDWVGDFDINTDVMNGRHASFDLCAQNICNRLESLMGENLTNKSIKYIICGHSRGGAVGNLVSVELMEERGVSQDNIYDYNFAPPDVAVRSDFKAYNNMFNIIHTNDLIPKLPGPIEFIYGKSWGKYGRNLYFTDNDNTSVPSAHSSKTYAEFLDMRIDPKAWNHTIKNFEMTLVEVRCPVDVIITDVDGNKIGSVINGETDYYNSDFGDVIIITEGDKKYFYVDDKEFKVILVGTDDGTMTYSIKDCNLTTGEIFESKTFSNVLLENGKTMYSPVSEAETTDDVQLYITKEKDGEIIYTHTIGEDGTETIIPCTEHNYDSNIVVPTCTEQGYTTYTCSDCGDSYINDYVDALGHTNGDIVEENYIAPSCTENGSKENVTYCTVCGVETSREQENIPATGHSYTEEITKIPTHTESGEKTFTCACGDSYIEVIEATGDHVYVESITKAPTCTETGIKTFTCVCGDSYTEEISANGHTLTQVDAKTPTCTEIGYEAYEYCSNCDYTTYVEVPVTGHSYTEEVTKIPTHTESGEKTFTCACGASYTEVIEATGDHAYVESITKAPTCTESGEKTFTCVCGDSYTEEISANGHTLTQIDAKTPTCTETGYKAYEYCSNCDYTTYVEVPATGHSYTEEVTKIPTHTESGEKTLTCACGDSYTEVIEATGDHVYVESITKAPTCTESGEKTFICACGDTYTEVIDATGHNMVACEVVPPTCTTGGYTTYNCSACGDAYTADETSALGHSFENGACKVCGEKDPTVPEEPEYNYTFSIQSPSRTEIRNKDGIILHAKVEGNTPNGSYVRWESSNGNFSTSADGSNLKIIARNKGYTTFTAILCDADGNELARDSVEMYSKSGFFDKIGGFFRSLFGTTKIYEN